MDFMDDRDRASKGMLHDVQSAKELPDNILKDLR